jgi:L-lactate dehydrogenase complex protein LldG
MSSSGGSRAEILGRIQLATGSAAPDPAASYAALQRYYVRVGHRAVEERVALMIERMREYDAEVVETAPDSLPEMIATQLAASERHIFVAPDGLPAEWMPTGFDWMIDRKLSTAEIEKADGVVTAAFCGIADSGTIVLHHSAAEGRRLITLLPDWHLCVLRASDVVETLPQYFARCSQAPGLATYISGPSATADIEMTRIKGVHGPRFLHVILVRDDA